MAGAPRSLPLGGPALVPLRQVSPGTTCHRLILSFQPCPLPGCWHSCNSGWGPLPLAFPVGPLNQGSCWQEGSSAPKASVTLGWADPGLSGRIINDVPLTFTDGHTVKGHICMQVTGTTPQQLKQVVSLSTRGWRFRAGVTAPPGRHWSRLFPPSRLTILGMV